MKKYLFGISALVLALTFTAFKAKKPNFVDNQVFKLKTGVSRTSEVALENRANWIFEGVLNSTATRCDDVDDVACKIIVDAAHKTGTSLTSNITIDATPGCLDNNCTPEIPGDDIQYYRISSVTAPGYTGDYSNATCPSICTF